MEDINKIANNIFVMSEDCVYHILERFEKEQLLDKAMTYAFVKAFFIHTVKLALAGNDNLEKFDAIYEAYKRDFIEYYKLNNSGIDQELLNSIEESFKGFFDISESMLIENLDDGYEYRHHIIDTFEIFRKILEKKSKTNIRQDLFENNITEIKNTVEKICEYILEEIK